MNEVAKDLGLQNKEVLEILQKYTKTLKKHMTPLEESELDIVFDRFTQDTEMESLDAYFAARNTPAAEPQPEAPQPEAAPAPQEKAPEAPAEEKPAPKKDAGKPAEKGAKPEKGDRAAKPKKPQEKPAGQKPQAAPAQQSRRASSPPRAPSVPAAWSIRGPSPSTSTSTTRNTIASRMTR